MLENRVDARATSLSRDGTKTRHSVHASTMVPVESIVLLLTTVKKIKRKKERKEERKQKQNERKDISNRVVERIIIVEYFIHVYIRTERENDRCGIIASALSRGKIERRILNTAERICAP